MDELEAQRRKGNESRLCDLPNTILQHILCLLGMKDAVRMSLVSKQWESLWRSVPKLELSEKGIREREIFMYFVERTIYHRDTKSPIESFSLSCRVYEAWYLWRWLAAILVLEVQHLSLVLRSCSALKLPSCICLRSETLKTLHLETRGILTLPEQIHLPRLKEVTLRYTKYTDNDSIRNLVSSPSLERLSIHECRWKKALTFSSSSLHTLSIKYYASECPDVEIHAPNLKVFSYEGKLVSRYVILGSPLLDEVKILLDPLCAVSNIPESLPKLLQDISHVKSLSFSMPFLPTPMPVDPTKIFPTFWNLINLNIDASFMDMDWKLLSSIFTSCPSLQALEFSSIGILYKVYKRIRQDPSRPVYLPKLKKITIRGTLKSFLWEHTDSVLEVFLRDALVLEEIVLACNICAFEEMKRLKESLSKLPRASESCIIRIVSYSDAQSLRYH